MDIQRSYIDAIVNGDDKRLISLLQAEEDGDPLIATIKETQPTNHAIGHGMTLLQLASIRERKNGNPSKVLIEHGAEVDLHSACGLGMNERIVTINTFRYSEQSTLGDRGSTS